MIGASRVKWRKITLGSAPNWVEAGCSIDANPLTRASITQATRPHVVVGNPHFSTAVRDRSSVPPRAILARVMATLVFGTSDVQRRSVGLVAGHIRVWRKTPRRQRKMSIHHCFSPDVQVHLS